jgi:hypothetical protein
MKYLYLFLVLVVLARGIWVKDLEFCSIHSRLCTPSGERWYEENLTIMNHHQACDLFREKKIEHLEFVGDSFIRHFYQGFILLLTNDYQRGATTSDDPSCFDNGQFEEKKCRHATPKSVSLCNGSLSASLTYGTNPIPTEARRNSMVVWGIGNHPAFDRYDIPELALNAESHIEKYLRPYCQSLKNGEASSLIWVPPHCRVSAYNEFQTNERVMAFQSQTIAFLKENCPGIKFLPFCNLTLGIRDPFQQNMTWYLIFLSPAFLNIY